MRNAPAAVGGAVDVLGPEQGLGVVEPVEDGGVVVGVEVHVDGLREFLRGRGGRGGG